MHNVREISENIFWIGMNDRRLERFENMFPLPKGVSYNSYLILDEKTVVMDTVDVAFSTQFVDNIKYVLNGRKLDYLVVNHMEPDHCGNIERLLEIYPDVKLIGNKKTFAFFEQFYSDNYTNNYYLAKKDEVIDLGKHKLQFINAPMVHWPEVTLAYENTKKILFASDAFGSFGALNGNIFMDEIEFKDEFLDESRRYYSNIVGKFGPQVQNVLKKASDLEINLIAPLHGPIPRTAEDIKTYIDLYSKWSSYTPEKEGVVIAFGSMYGNTENFADIVACKLAEKGVKDIKIYDVSKTHPSYIISEAWKYSTLLFAAPTYNLGLYHNMETLIHELAALNFKNRKVALAGNHTWASGALKTMKKMFEEQFKDIEIIGDEIDLKSAMHPKNEELVDQLVENIYNAVKG